MTLDSILQALEMAESIAAEFPPVSVGASIALKLTQIAQAAANAHVAATGKPMDLSTLKQIAPVA